MTLIAYVAYTAIGLLFSFMGLAFAMTGGTDGLYITGGSLLLAYAWAIYYVVKKEKAGEGARSAFVLALPMPLVSVMQVVYMIGSSAVAFVIPNSETFSSECETAGAQFMKSPALPVHSIAYYYDAKHPPHFTSLSVSWGKRISSLSYYNPPSHPTLEFTETGPNAFGQPYIRHPKAGKDFGIDALTADVLVKFDMRPEEELRKALGSQGLVIYELTVFDQRTNEKLASLRYVTDTVNKRACGFTGANTLSESAFILKAVGLQ